MIKYYLSSLALGLILCSPSPLKAQTKVNCSSFCHAGGMACMRACTDIFRNEKKCSNICQYSDKMCTESCTTSVCKYQCDKTTHTATDKKNCYGSCEAEGEPRSHGLLKDW